MKLSIKYKIFFTLLLTSIIVAISLHTFLRWNFDRGFSKYVHIQELELVDRLSVGLASHYKLNGSWQFIKNNHLLWRQLHLNMASSRQGGEDMGLLKPGSPPPRPFPRPGPKANPDHGPPNDLGPRLILFDMNKNWIIGSEEFSNQADDLKLRPIKLDGEMIGYIALIPGKIFFQARDRHFIEKQMDAFAIIAVFMVALSLLLSYPVTLHLLQPIKALTNGTRKLIAGCFKTRIPVTTGDELGRLSEDFNILAATLQKNEQNRKQWVADISHELRTPLAILRGEIEAIQDGIRKPEPQTIDALHIEIKHLERMVSDLYELSMSDLGALNYKKISVDPVAILQGTVELFKQRFETKKLSIDVALSVDKHCTLLADPDRLQQLFVNLLENSLRYTDSPGQLRINVQKVEHNLVIFLEDSSPGIPLEQLPKIFDRLYRVEASRNRETGGAGLGLAICKNIVDAHQGHIVAENSGLGGILIRIDLPFNV